MRDVSEEKGGSAFVWHDVVQEDKENFFWDKSTPDLMNMGDISFPDISDDDENHLIPTREEGIQLIKEMMNERRHENILTNKK